MAILEFRYGPALAVVQADCPAVADVTYTNEPTALVDCPTAEAEAQARDWYGSRGWREIVTP